MEYKELKENVKSIVEKEKIIDIHTHLFAPEFGELFLYGIDEILTYHYLVAEFFTYEDKISKKEFFKLSKKEQAELIWDKLFIENTPISEATKGVVTILQKLSIDVKEKNLDNIREYFKEIDLNEYTDRIFNLSNIKYVVMTNNPFNTTERKVWLNEVAINKKFKAALRIDDLLFDFNKVKRILAEEENLEIDEELDETTIKNLQNFLEKWIEIIGPLYFMCSLPPEFVYPTENEYIMKMIDKVIMPILDKYRLPFALMFGVKRQVNSELKLAGDAVGKVDINTVYALTTEFKSIKFLFTFLSRENIHESAVLARKFSNVRLFGCWWFTNIPLLIDEIVRMRMELIGLNFIPQHSDSRVFEQLLYKWEHFKNILIDILTDKYFELYKKGWVISKEEMERDIKNLFRDNFEKYLEK